MATSRLNLYHSGKRKDTKRNKSVHDEIKLDIEEGESLFKFETKDNSKNSGLFAQKGANPFVRSDKIEGVFAETLDRDNLGYLNSLIKTREQVDQMAAKKDRKQYNKSKSAKPENELFQPLEDINSPNLTVQKELFKQPLTLHEKPEHNLFSNKQTRSGEGDFYIENRESVQQINPQPVIESAQPVLTEVAQNYFTDKTPASNEPKDISSPYMKNKQKNTETDHEKQAGESGTLDFLNSVGEYLDYFDTAEQEIGEKSYSDYFSEKNESVDYLKQVLDQKQNEVYTLRGKLERMEMKLNESNNMNAVLMRELSKVKTQDETTKNKYADYEQEIEQLTKKNKEYKIKIQHMQDMLMKAKIDNENSLLALKKVLNEKNQSKGYISATKDSSRMPDYYFSSSPTQLKDSQQKYLEGKNKEQTKVSFGNYIKQNLKQTGDQAGNEKYQAKSEKSIGKEYGSLPRGRPQKSEELSDNESDDVAFSDEEISSQEYVENPAKFSKHPTNFLKKQLLSLLENSDNALDS